MFNLEIWERMLRDELSKIEKSDREQATVLNEESIYLTFFLDDLEASRLNIRMEKEVGMKSR